MVKCDKYFSVKRKMMMERKTEAIEKRNREKRYQQFDSGKTNIKHLLGHRLANRIMVKLITI